MNDFVRIDVSADTVFNTMLQDAHGRRMSVPVSANDDSIPHVRASGQYFYPEGSLPKLLPRSYTAQYLLRPVYRGAFDLTVWIEQPLTTVAVSMVRLSGAQSCIATDSLTVLSGRPGQWRVSWNDSGSPCEVRIVPTAPLAESP